MLTRSGAHHLIPGWTLAEQWHLNPALPLPSREGQSVTTEFLGYPDVQSLMGRGNAPESRDWCFLLVCLFLKKGRQNGKEL